MIPIEHSWQESCGNEIELLNFNPRKTFFNKSSIREIYILFITSKSKLNRVIKNQIEEVI